jgi:hypothetical protein
VGLADRVEVDVLGADIHYTGLEEEEGAMHSTVLVGLLLKPTWLWQMPLPNPLDVLRELGAL